MTTQSTSYKMALAIYILYLLSIFLPLLAIIGVVLAYVFQNDAGGNLQSHYKYLIRTFWIGLLYFIIAGISFIIIIGIILMPIAVVWWLVRSAKGLNDLLNNRFIANPDTWLF